MVFYRKYRPQTIEDLDSTAVRDMLHSVLQNLPAGRQGDVPHAFLFTGPKGLGKTSTARILAKAVNCIGNREKGVGKSSFEPCNTCEQCVAITNGTSLDILEIDAASNRGIDEIRELKEKIRLSPVSAKKKVYIIDEVHMLTTEAFNALLKTLEEPPDHAMFILCTTEPHKVPATILSRCFHVSFMPATEEELVRAFKRIATGEKLDVTDDALSYIAQLADRGFRDGVKILEEVSLLANGKSISKELVEEKYKVSGIKYFVFSMIEHLAARENKKTFELVSQLIEQGVDMKYFMTQLVETLHQMLLHQIDIQNTKYEIPDTKLSLEELKILFTLLTQAYGEMKYAVIPQLPLELAILDWCEPEVKGDPPAGEAGKGEVRSKVINDDGVSVSSLRKQIGAIKKTKALYGEPKKEKKVDEEAVVTSTVALEHTSNSGTETQEWLSHFWNNLIVEMKKHNHTVAGVLRGCTIKRYGDGQLVILASYKFHKERLDELKNREALVQVVKLLTGKDIEITIELKK